MNENRIESKSGILACTGNSRGHPPEWIGAAGLPEGGYRARVAQPESPASRGHPLLSFGPGLDWPQCFKARDHPAWIKARDHPVVVAKIRIKSSEDSLIISKYACFLKPDGRGMPLSQRCQSRIPGSTLRVSGKQE